MKDLKNALVACFQINSIEDIFPERSIFPSPENDIEIFCPVTRTLQEAVEMTVSSGEYASIFLHPPKRTSYLSRHSSVIFGATEERVFGTKKLFSRASGTCFFFFLILFSPVWIS